MIELGLPPLKRRALTAALLTGTALFSLSASAGSERHETQIVTVKTADAEVVEADVTDLVIGESRSFVTDSGRTVDLLRGPDGLEIYLDGELLDALHAHATILHEELEMDIDCDAGDPTLCEQRIAIAVRGDEAAEVTILRDDVEIICSDDAADCEDFSGVSENVGTDTEHHAAVDGKHVVIVHKRKIEEN